MPWQQMRVRRRLELLLRVRAGQDAGHDRGAGTGPGLEVADGVAGDRDVLDRLDAETHDRPQHEVGVRPAAQVVLRAEREVDEVAPAERIEDVPEVLPAAVGRQADPDPFGPERGERRFRARQRFDVVPRDRAHRRALQVEDRELDRHSARQ